MEKTSMDTFFSKEELLIQKLIEFYSNPQHLNVFISIVEQGTVISLRLLDWFSTNYSKFNRVYINRTDIHSDYKDQLKGYKKAYFDPFCRRQRIFLMCRNGNIRTPLKGNLSLHYKKIDNHEDYLGKEEGIVTTVGQLNFFKWCMEKNIISYIIAHIANIENSMLEVTSQKKSELKKPKEKNNVYKTIMQVTVKFT